MIKINTESVKEKISKDVSKKRFQVEVAGR